jgi:anti-sigma-K factor RskA
VKDFPELAALADGSLRADRRAPLEEQVLSSAELAGLLAEQQRAVALARSAAAAVTAPPGLRVRVEAQRHARHSRARARLGLGLAGAAAAVAAVAIGLIAFESGTAPEQFRGALVATPSARGPSGEATLTRTSSGWRIQLDTAGLPRLDHGRFYEAWLRNRAGVLVPAGTLNGGKRVTLWAGVSPAAFSTVTVTRERADGDQASSGEKVLIGHLRRS